MEELRIERTPDDLKAGLAARKQAPDRDYLRRKYPHAYREVTDPKTGLKEWRVGGKDRHGRPRLKPHEQREFNASMRAFMHAEAERGANIRARRPRNVVLKDQDGMRRYIHPVLADSAARRNGWRSGEAVRVTNPIRNGEGGMLWKLVAGQWSPLDRWCLSRPWTQKGRPTNGRKDGTMLHRGLQYDPDGNPWRHVGHEWVRLADVR